MYSLKVTLPSRLDPKLWDLVSGLLYQFDSQGIEEGEEPAPEGEKALHTANEFELALAPGTMLPPDTFTAYFETKDNAERAKRAVQPVLAPLKPEYEILEVEEKDYAELWRKSFQPIEAAPNWYIHASWHSPVTTREKIELIIEPGMAFGTGSHETTKGCLELISQAHKAQPFNAQSNLLDFGCGSGILAIAMKKLGAGRVLGVDIDPLALEASQSNASTNHVTIETAMEVTEGGFDGIVANILKNTLLEFGPSFKSWLKPGGFLILSGILAEQKETIVDHFQKLGFKLQNTIKASSELPNAPEPTEWVSLLLLK